MIAAPGLLLQAIGFAWVAFEASVDASYVELVLGLLVAGVGVSMGLPTLPTEVLNAVEPDQLGTASGINSSLQRFGTVFGLAIVGAVFAAHGSLATPATITGGFRPAVAVAAALALLGDQRARPGRPGARAGGRPPPP